MVEVPVIDFWSRSSSSIYRRVVHYYASAKPVKWVFDGKYRKLAKGVAILLSHYRAPFLEAVAMLENDCAKLTPAEPLPPSPTIEE